MSQSILNYVALVASLSMTIPSKNEAGDASADQAWMTRYQYRLQLNDAIKEVGPTHTEIRFGVIMQPRRDVDRRQLSFAETQGSLLNLIDLQGFVFTLFDGDKKAREPADLFPWETPKRIRFYMLRRESEEATAKNKLPTMVVKLVYPNYILSGRPSIQITDDSTETSVKISDQGK